MQNQPETFKSRARGFVSLMVRPVWRRIWARVEGRLAIEEVKRQALEARLATQEATCQQLAATVTESTGPHSQSSEKVFALQSNVNQIDDKVTKLESAWHQHVPAFLNSVASVAAIAREQAHVKKSIEALQGRFEQPQLRHTAEATPVAVVGENLQTEINNLWAAASRTNKEHADLWKRLEFIRSELLYEMRYGAGSSKHVAEKAPRVASRVINAEKYEQARETGFRLNLGSGHVPLDGFLNVDMRDVNGVDIVAGLDSLPFQAKQVSEIFSAHVLEHFPQEQFRRVLLPYWFDLLKPGGVFRAIVPDAKAMIRACAKDHYSFDDFREVFFGGQDYDGDFHYNMFTADSLKQALEGAGFEQVDVVAEGRKNDIAFELEVTARRPA
jgi:uncharacterized coiled-coil protein SlyX